MDLWSRLKSRLQVSNTKGIQIFAFDENQYTVLKSTPKEIFTLGVHKDAVDILKKEGKLELGILQLIPEIVYAECQDLGFKCDPVNMLVSLVNGVHPTLPDASIGTSLIMPPIVLKTGEKISRKIVLFRNWSEEMGSFEVLLKKASVANLEVRSVSGGRPSISDLSGVRETKAISSFAHEVVHLLVTDVASGHFSHLNLQELEILTDSIALRSVLRFFIMNKTIEFYWFGVLEGLGYLTNALGSEGKINLGSMDITLERMIDRAEKIISNSMHRNLS
ncbi:MAG: hypothetical protein ABIQ95_02015 [Bdellovibrionia bacterium]